MTRTMAKERDTPESPLGRALEGDRAAFDEVFGLVEPRVRAFVASRSRSRTGPDRAPLDVDEVVQDAMVRAFRSIGGFRGGEDVESFVRWLLGIARIAMIHASRPCGRRGANGRPELSLDREVPAPRVSPSTDLRRHERFDRLEQALRGLGDEARRVVRMARIEGISLVEIARRTGRSPDAVRKLLGRSLRALRERMGETESLHLPQRELRGSDDDAE